MDRTSVVWRAHEGRSHCFSTVTFISRLCTGLELARFWISNDDRLTVRVFRGKFRQRQREEKEANVPGRLDRLKQLVQPADRLEVFPSKKSSRECRRATNNFLSFFFSFFSRDVSTLPIGFFPPSISRGKFCERSAAPSLSESVYFRHADEWSQETRREENVKKRWWMIEMVNVECLASSSTPVGEVKHLLYRLLLPVVYFKRLSCKR